MKNVNKLVLAILFFFPLIVLAQVVNEPSVPIMDVFNDIAELVKNFKGMKGIAVASAIVMIIVQLAKTEILGSVMDKTGPFVKRAFITILGQIAGILMAISGGMGWLDAIIAGLLTSGGAVAIWEAIKPLFKKKE